MRSLLCALALGALVTTSAGAAELKPGQGETITLNGVSGVAYYTVEAGGYRVIAVLASGAAAEPVRFQAVLQPGQAVAISVPGAAGTVPAALEIARRGDVVVVAEPAVALN